MSEKDIDREARKFWRKVYVASISRGTTISGARINANTAVADYYNKFANV